MDFAFDARTEELRAELLEFMDDARLPGRAGVPRAARRAGEPLGVVHRPGARRAARQARSRGLWNLFLPGEHGAGLTNLQYAPLAEITGRSRPGARPR